MPGLGWFSPNGPTTVRKTARGPIRCRTSTVGSTCRKKLRGIKTGGQVSKLNIGNFIWNIADDVLRDIYVRGKYLDVILPMTVVRRIDTVLEPTKDAVLRRKEQLDKDGVANPHAALCHESGEAFYNTSNFVLRDLTARVHRQQLKSDFGAYFDGFSPNVSEVLARFKFRNQTPTLIEADVLGFLLGKFLDPSVNLSPRPVPRFPNQVRHPVYPGVLWARSSRN